MIIYSPAVSAADLYQAFNRSHDTMEPQIANTCVHSAGLKAIVRDSQHQLKSGSTTNCLQESCTAATECSTMTFYVLLATTQAHLATLLVIHDQFTVW